jgi:photosystem II stability/assembly factor-like uncharacterized protein
MKLRYMLIVLTLTLSACNISVTSFPAASGPTVEAPTEIPPTPVPDTPAPPTVNAPVVESPSLVQVQFLNELNGWGVTETQIVRTNDGGMTWYNVTPSDLTETGSTVATFFLDNEHAWVLKADFNNYPNNGLLYRTTDGGLTWTFSATAFSSGDLSFIDANNGWMLADLGVGAGSNAVAVYQTKDAGVSWSQTYTNDPNLPDAGNSLPLGGLKSDLVPLTMKTAWVDGVTYASGSAYLFRTDDGGHTWTQVSLPLPSGAENFELGIDRDQMRFFSAKDGFLVVRMSGEATQTAVYTTNDAGSTWTLTPTLIPNAGPSEFLSAQEAILYNGKQFYITRDAAQTWTTLSPNIVFGDSFASMDFVDLNTGWIITLDPNNHRSLYRTNDGGATWSPVIP